MRETGAEDYHLKTSVIKGKTVVIGEFVSADVILPARHSFLNAEDMATHVLKELEPTINERIRSSPILLAGKAFGYGTGRESPARALRAAGVRVILGGPFARMFFRNAINNGILVLDCPKLIADGVPDGSVIAVDIDKNEVRWGEQVYLVPPVPQIVRRIMDAGNLIEYGRMVIGAGQGEHYHV